MSDIKVYVYKIKTEVAKLFSGSQVGSQTKAWNRNKTQSGFLLVRPICFMVLCFSLRVKILHRIEVLQCDWIIKQLYEQVCQK